MRQYQTKLEFQEFYIEFFIVSLTKIKLFLEFPPLILKSTHNMELSASITSVIKEENTNDKE